MYRNFFKSAFRNLLRHKTYTLINIGGLAIGIAVSLTIFMVIRYQTSFDTFHPQKDHLYRVLTRSHQGASGNISYNKEVPFPLPTSIKADFPQIQQVAPVWESHNDQLLIPDPSGATQRSFKENRGVFFTTPSFFRMFDFPLLAGSYQSLKDPNTVLLTKDMATKYFGDWKTAMGKTLTLQVGGSLFSHGSDELKVTGILAPIPANTDFQCKMVVAFGTGITVDMAANTDWQDRTNTDFGCYLMLPEGISVDGFNQELRGFAQKVRPSGDKDGFIIEPLSAVHFDTRAGDYSGHTLSHQLINVLWLIAAFITLIACVNFVNLSTAQAVHRAREVGVRKVLGSNKSQLQIQFFLETALIVLSAVVLAVLIDSLALPWINQLLAMTLSLPLLGHPEIALVLLAFTAAVTALAGFYPSLVLSRFNPVHALKSKITSAGTRGISLRRGLVVFQFVIAQALIIGTLIIIKQMSFFMNQPLGFDKDAMITVPFRVDSLRLSRLDYLRQQLLSLKGVQAVSFSSNSPIEDAGNLWSTFKFDHADKEAGFKAITKFADDQYVPTYHLQLVAGRNLQPSKMTREFLVNESFVKKLGLARPQDILNKEISIWGDRIQCPVVGVVKDFIDRSFRNGLAPMLITTDDVMYSQAAIKVGTTGMSSTLQSMKKIWEQTFPGLVYEYRFLDDKIASFYAQENQLAILYKIFASIAILLSCLGLYGLASFMALKRVKEVGIRKVLGASAGSIVILFSKEFILLMVIAFAIAAPLAGVYMEQWLQGYAYRIHLHVGVFAAGGLAAVMIALLTLSFQAIKSAVANPVNSLRAQ